jgi:hypothetical protein
MSHSREFLGIGLTCDQRLKHTPAGDSDYIADHGIKLDVGALQRFLDALCVTGALPDKLSRSRKFGQWDRWKGCSLTAM